MAYYIGIDLGTSSVKMLLMEETGAIVGAVSREYPISFPREGWSEQNPEDWWDAVQDGLREMTAACPRSEIKGVSFGGQMHGLVMLDAEDRVIRPAILWNDGRTQAQCEYLNEEIGRQKLADYTANIAFPGFTAPKLLWVRENEPENFARIRKIMLPKDYVAYRMTGVHCTDVSDAAGMLLLDVANRRWSPEMLALCGICEEQLPKLFESYEVVGTVRPDLAAALGLDASVKVIAGAGDNAAAAIGTGTVSAGQCNISLGTSGTLFVAQDRCAADPNGALHSFAHANGQYHLLGCILSAASCNKWWLEDILGTQDYAGSQAGIRTLGENSVYFLPYLMGERSPHNDPNLRSLFLGMNMATTRSEMTQAVLEGVSFAIRDCVEAARALGVNPTRSTICGGGAKSPLWCSIMANVLDLELSVPETEEGPSYGAAILAAVGCGAYPDVRTAAERLIKTKRVYKPDPVLVEKYERSYQKFRRLYPAVKHLFS